MTDLPDSSSSGLSSQALPTVGQQASSQLPVSYGSREIEHAGVGTGTEMPLAGIGQEIDVPKEVAQAGVVVQPQTIPLPPQIIQAGVQPAGANIPTQPTSGASVHLPLTDEQVAKALHASVTSSVRWLAEWCVKQMKKIHRTIQKK